jgi:hypothetical protein
MRKLRKLRWLAIFVQRHPHFGEVVEVAAKPKTTACPLKCLRFETLVHLIQLVNQQHTGLLALQSAHERTWAKEVTSLQVRLHALPAVVLRLRELHVEPLQALIKPANGFVFRDAPVAL